MIQFFHDNNLKYANSQASPKRFLVNESGGAKNTTVFLADTYEAHLTAAATVNQTTLYLDKTDEFLSSGTAVITSTLDLTYISGINFIDTVTGILYNLTVTNGSLTTYQISASANPLSTFSLIDTITSNTITLSIIKGVLTQTNGGTQGVLQVTINDTATAAQYELSIANNALTLTLGNSLANSTITYSGKTANSLTGVSGVTSNLNIGVSIKPWKVYKTNGNITFVPQGADLAYLTMALGADQSSLNFPNFIYVLNKTSYDNIQDSPIPISAQVVCPSGLITDYNQLFINSNIFYVKDKNDNSSILVTDKGYTATCYCDVHRKNQTQIVNIRILPSRRAISNQEPGFIIGQYRWRDSSNENANILNSTAWDPDINAIGTDKFISGIGFGQDLEPIDIESTNSSIYLRIKDGTYFAGPYRFYLPANPQTSFLGMNALSFTLSPAPNQIEPIFIGNWILDSNKFYQLNEVYAYQPGEFNLSSAENVPTYQYIINRATSTVQLNKALSQEVYYLGTISGDSTDYFDMPVYPVDSIVSVYIDRGVGNPSVYSSSYSFNRTMGTLSITTPMGSGPSIPGALIGEPVYALCNPAVAVIYDSGQNTTRLITDIDLNPAYAGISEGYVYLQHTRQEPTKLTLSCDKPIIDIPATYSSILNLIAYGPVYYNGDYALLTAQAIGPLNNQPIFGANLVVLPGVDFSGTINNENPMTTKVIVRTGADGKANFIYLPDKNYGFYIPTTTSSLGSAGLTTTNITNDTIVLADPIAIDRLYNSSDGWLVKIYCIYNNNPLYGSTTANTSIGQILWSTSGIAGTTSYQTNGQRLLWANGVIPITPTAVIDTVGNQLGTANFNGNVKSLVFPTTLPYGATIGAYFVSVIERVSLQVEYLGTNLKSNTILIEMAEQPDLNQNPWLIINDATNGLLNQYRLGLS